MFTSAFTPEQSSKLTEKQQSYDVIAKKDSDEKRKFLKRKILRLGAHFPLLFRAINTAKTMTSMERSEIEN
jgi:hypothetical protein